MRIPSALVVVAFALGSPGLCAAQTARLGAHYGVNLSDGHWEQERLGLQGEVRVVGPLVVSGGISRFLNYPGVTGLTGSASLTHANLRVRAPGKWGFVSIGYGFVVVRQSVEGVVQPGTTVKISDSEFTDTGGSWS